VQIPNHQLLAKDTRFEEIPKKNSIVEFVYKADSSSSSVASFSNSQLTLNPDANPSYPACWFQNCFNFEIFSPKKKLGPLQIVPKSS